MSKQFQVETVRSFLTKVWCVFNVNGLLRQIYYASDLFVDVCALV